MRLHCSGHDHPVEEVWLHSSLGSAGTVDLRMDSPGHGAFLPQPGQVAEFRCGSALSFGPLRLFGDRQDWWHGEPMAAPPPERPGLTIFQGRAGECAGEFSSRVMASTGQSWTIPDGRDHPLDRSTFPEAWPPGGVCLVPAHFQATETAGALLATLRRNTLPLRGVSLGLQKGSGPGQWRFRFHCPESRDPNLHADLGSGWMLGHHPHGRTGQWVTQLGPALDDKALAALLEKLMDPNIQIIDAAGLKLPRLPMTIRFGGETEPLFARAIGVRFRRSREPGKPPWLFEAWLDLALDPVSHLPSWPAQTMLLAECVEVPKARGDKFYRVRPPGSVPSELPLRAPCKWTMDDDRDTLLTARVVPGFVRPGQAAFYSKLTRTDLVWVRAVHGELPLIVGSVHERFEQWEQGERAADVAIGVPQIEIQSAGHETSLRIESRRMQLAAPDQVTFQAGSVQAAQRLEVGGPAVFKADVTIG